MEQQQDCLDTYGRRLVLNKTIVYAAIATFGKVSSLGVVVVIPYNGASNISCLWGFTKHVQLTIMFVP